MPVVARKLQEVSGPSLDISAADFMQLGRNQFSLTVDNAAGRRETAPVTVTAVACILAETHAPRSVTSQLSHLTALTGRHVASWRDVRLTWGYESGSGVSAIFRDSL